MINKTLRILAISALVCAPKLFSAVKGQVIEITSMEQFNKLYKSDKPMVTMYTITGCMPCKITKIRFKKLASTMPDVNFCTVEPKFKTAEHNFLSSVPTGPLKSITSNFRAFPTFKFSHKGKPAQFSIDGRTTSSFVGGRSATQLKKYLTDFTAKYSNK